MKRRQHGDGALYPIRGGTLWRGVIDLGYDADGKRIQKYVHARTQRACRDKLETIKAEIAQHGTPLDKRTTLADFAAWWLEHVAKPDVDPNTFTAYKSLVNRWIVPTLGRRALHDLKPSDVSALRTAIIGAGKSPSTARQAHIVLGRILLAARAERLVTRNVADDVRKPRADKGVRGALTTPQAIAILEAAHQMPDGQGARWWFKLLGGPRQGEILGATLADLDLDAGLYRVAWKLESLAREHGCTDAEPCGYRQAARCPRARWRVPDGHESRQIDGAWHLTRPKSSTGRIVPLIPQLVNAIRQHLAATADEPNPHGLIWHDGTGRPIRPRDDAAEWRTLLVSAGVIAQEDNHPGGTELTGHCARHTTVTVLASLGVDHQLIGEIVGHSSVQVTDMYRHAHAAEKQAAMRALGTAWAAALPQLEA